MEKVLGKHREVPGAPAEAGRCPLTIDDLNTVLQGCSESFQP